MVSGRRRHHHNGLWRLRPIFPGSGMRIGRSLTRPAHRSRRSGRSATTSRRVTHPAAADPRLTPSPISPSATPRPERLDPHATSPRPARRCSLSVSQRRPLPDGGRLHPPSLRRSGRGRSAGSAPADTINPTRPRRDARRWHRHLRGEPKVLTTEAVRASRRGHHDGLRRAPARSFPASDMRVGTAGSGRQGVAAVRRSGTRSNPRAEPAHQARCRPHGPRSRLTAGGQAPSTTRVPSRSGQAAPTSPADGSLAATRRDIGRRDDAVTEVEARGLLQVEQVRQPGEQR